MHQSYVYWHLVPNVSLDYAWIPVFIFIIIFVSPLSCYPPFPTVYICFFNIQYI